ncbi:MAG TPA: right-handed parallel beta-helix repeat-containing protein [Gammaproteobacteria bacterium]|nr:right-handed parallel beta-helix repeat-containing protein [Gammaproteobacteria bacterium]
MNKMYRFFAAMIAAFALSSAHAATYYVSAAGDDGNSGTSPTKAFKTPERAMTALAGGDAVLFRAGDTFVLKKPLYIEASGTSSQHTIIGAYAPGSDGTVKDRALTNRPILDGNKQVPTLGTYVGILQITGQYVEVRDLRLNNSGGEGLRFHETSHGWVKNVTTDWSYFAGMQLYKASDISFSDCEVTGFGRNYKDYGERVQPVGISLRTGTNVTVRGCIVHEGWGEGINVFYGSSNVLVEKNRVYAVRNVGIYVDSSQNVTVRNNIVLGTSDEQYYRYGPGTWVGPGLALNNESYQYASEGGSLPGSAILHDVSIYDNLVAGTKVGIAFWGEMTTTNWQNVVVAHNTFVENQQQIAIVNDRPFSNARIVNNIFMSITSGTQDYSGLTVGSGITWANNYWSGDRPSQAGSPGDVKGGLQLNKMTGWRSLKAYTDVTWRDFQPVSGSKTLGAGSEAVKAIVTADYNEKPWAMPPDMGGVSASSAAPSTDARVPKAPHGLSPSNVGG